MVTGKIPFVRRPDALSKERIVAAAIEILDAEGESALTFRVLTSRLSTGAGAIYWHVANKDELLAAAADDVLARAMAEVSGESDPRLAIRAIGLSVFDAVQDHPWIGAQVTREPWQSAVLRIIESLGRQLGALDLSEQQQFDYASALTNYLLGLAGQHAAGARVVASHGSRAGFLQDVSSRWLELDPAEYAFVRRFAARLPDHDDREQFLAGLDVFLAGLAGPLPHV